VNLTYPQFLSRLPATSQPFRCHNCGLCPVAITHNCHRCCRQHRAIFACDISRLARLALTATCVIAPPYPVSPHASLAPFLHHHFSANNRSSCFLPCPALLFIVYYVFQKKSSKPPPLLLTYFYRPSTHRTAHTKDAYKDTVSLTMPLTIPCHFARSYGMKAGYSKTRRKVNLYHRPLLL
jgi:hypothetical protein